MSTSIQIPDVLHICPECQNDVVSGEKHCRSCRRKLVQAEEFELADQLRNAWRMHQLFSTQPRLTGRMPEQASPWAMRRMWGAALAACAAFWSLVGYGFSKLF